MAPETPKGISSRLLTMKFMQRAAASSGSTPGSESEGPSAKKRKLGQDSPTGYLSVDIDQASVQAALDEREAKRQAALERHAGGDTHWVLDTHWQKKAAATKAVQPMKVVYVGYGDADSSDEQQDDPRQGRTSTKKVQGAESQKPSKSDESESESESDQESDVDSTTNGRSQAMASTNSPSNQKSRSRSQSRSSSKQKIETSNAKEFRDKRKKKEVRLNQLSSISSAGDGNFGSKQSAGAKAMTCYVCHQPGHRAADCSQKGSKNSRQR